MLRPTAPPKYSCEVFKVSKSKNRAPASANCLILYSNAYIIHILYLKVKSLKDMFALYSFIFFKGEKNMRWFLIKILYSLYYQGFELQRKRIILFYSKKKAKKARKKGRKMALAHLKKYPNINYELQQKLADQLQFLEGMRPDPD